MSGKSAAAVTLALREIRRGESPDEIGLIDEAGNVVLLHAHGVHPGEQLRIREAALRLLESAGARRRA